MARQRGTNQLLARLPRQDFARLEPQLEPVTLAFKEPLIPALILRYANAMLGVLAQGVACNRAHTIVERMSRWLLMTHDRVDEDEFPLTQEFLGQMLGVRRATVNLAGTTLQEAGLIRYSRGRIRVVDRAGLEDAACECYEFIKQSFERALRE